MSKYKIENYLQNNPPKENEETCNSSCNHIEQENIKSDCIISQPAILNIEDESMQECNDESISIPETPIEIIKHKKHHNSPLPPPIPVPPRPPKPKKNKPLQLKRGKSIAFKNANILLFAGQPAFETDTFKLKIGDGIRRWNDLPYVCGANGKSAYEIWIDEGHEGTIEDFLESLKGKNGLSAYEVWRDIYMQDPTLTVDDYINFSSTYSWTNFEEN